MVSPDPDVVGDDAMGDQEIRTALDRYWTASDAGDRDAAYFAS